MNIDDQLVDAIERGDVDRVNAILQAHPNLVDGPGWTPPPLHCAVLFDQPAVAEALLGHGANIEQLDSDRQTPPLRYAIIYAKPALVRLFLAHGANSGPIPEDGRNAWELAKAAAAGEYEQFDDLPSRHAYADVAAILQEHVVNSADD